jgi:glutathione S-transferase
MKLYYAPASPFVRKVMIVAIEAGVDHHIERIVTNPQAPTAAFLADNPLAKVPALVLDDGAVLYDSPVICEYLDSLNPGARLFPELEPALWQALRRQALADGILDAAVLCRLEGFRPEGQRSAEWLARQWGKVDRGLAALEGEAAGFNDEALTIGLVSIAAALGWLDFRFPDRPWRPERPMLDAWYEAFATRASMLATVPREA